MKRSKVMDNRSLIIALLYAAEDNWPRFLDICEDMGFNSEEDIEEAMERFRSFFFEEEKE
jgi:hypothetical protein